MWNQAGSFANRDAMLGVGAQAPKFLFWEDPRDQEMQLHAMQGRPLVVAFSPRFRIGEPGPVDALAAELRALGASLIVVTADSIWLHQSDEFPMRYEFGMMLGTSRDVVHHAFGLRTNDSALFILDARNIVRWRCAAATLAHDEAKTVLHTLLAPPVTARNNNQLSNQSAH